MRNFGLRVALNVVATAIALAVASTLLDGMHIGGPVDFVVAVLLFAGANLIVLPIAVALTARYVAGSLGLVALLANVVVLALTDVLSDGIDVDGVGTYILAVVIIWIANFAIDLIPGPWRRARLREGRPDRPG